MRLPGSIGGFVGGHGINCRCQRFQSHQAGENRPIPNCVLNEKGWTLINLERMKFRRRGFGSCGDFGRLRARLQF